MIWRLLYCMLRFPTCIFYENFESICNQVVAALAKLQHASCSTWRNTQHCCSQGYKRGGSSLSQMVSVSAIINERWQRELRYNWDLQWAHAYHWIIFEQAIQSNQGPRTTRTKLLLLWDFIERAQHLDVSCQKIHKRPKEERSNRMSPVSELLEWRRNVWF